MADNGDAVLLADRWLTALATLAGTVAPRVAASGAEKLLLLRSVHSVLAPIDPLLRQPLAEVLFPRDNPNAIHPMWDAARGHVLAPYGMPMETAPVALRLRSALCRYFAPEVAIGEYIVDTRARWAVSTVQGSDFAPAFFAPRLAIHLVSFSIVNNYALAASLYDRFEAELRSDRLPTWFSYPDDLLLIELRAPLEDRMLLTRRADHWHVLIPPFTYRLLTDPVRGPSGPDGQADPAGDREPRVPSSRPAPTTPTPRPMADLDDAVAFTARWWVDLDWVCRRMDLANPIGTDRTKLRDVWEHIDPLQRRPLADHLFPLVVGPEIDGTAAPRPLCWAFIVSPPSVPHLPDDAVRLLTPTTRDQFVEATTRLGQVLYSLTLLADLPTGAEASQLCTIGRVAHDYQHAAGLYEQVEVMLGRAGMPTWFAYPDDLCLVTFDAEYWGPPLRGIRHFGRRSSFLLSRRGNRWFVVLTPSTFEQLSAPPHQPGGGADPAGDREPRVPVLPSRSHHADHADPPA